MADSAPDKTAETVPVPLDPTKSTSSAPDHAKTTTDTVIINASGHVQELSRNFSLLSLAGVGLVVGNVWPAIGGSILVAIFNGGPPGVLFEFIAVSIFYWAVAASIAELASAIPSTAGVYHWASVTPGAGSRLGKALGFFAGWWNYFAWVMGAASMASIFGNTIVQMYALNHAGFEAKPWHVFVVYIISTWLACAAVCLGNKAMPHVNNFAVFLILAGFLITIVVVVAMPGHGGRPPHATSSFVWKEWTADLGYPDGMVFLLGMLSGAFSVGAVNATTQLAEEIAHPQINVPKAIGLQMSIGFVTGLAYLIAIMYAINDYDALFESPYPIAEIYRQATGSVAGAIGLLVIICLCIGLTIIGLAITSGRTLYALARDGVTPFSHVLGQVNPSLDVPVWSTIVSAALATVLGCIYLGSTTAFNALVGTFILLSTSGFIAAILPNLLSGRKNITYGPFHMRGWIGFVVNGVACTYMIVWFFIYCFPFTLPTTVSAMNWASLIWGGLTLLMALWWFFGVSGDYEGPKTTGGMFSEAETIKGHVKHVSNQQIC